MRDKLRIVLRFGAKFGEALLAQWLERAAVNRKVTGSIPVGSVFSTQSICVSTTVLLRAP